MLPSLRTICFMFILLYSNNALETFYNDNGIISCNATQDCEITCNQINGCKNAQINCPNEHSCNIICSATKSCDGLIINATYSSLLTINDCNTGYFACKGLSIYLPPNDNGTPRANIYGANNGLSQGAGINDINDGEHISVIHFYAIHGWNDINIVNYSGNFQYHGGIMHCSSEYNETCIFSSNAWTCQNVDDICHHVDVTTSSTPSPYVPTTPEQLESISTDVKSRNDSSSTFWQSIDKLWYIIAVLFLSLCCLSTILVYFIIDSFHLQRQFYDKYEQTAHQIRKLSDSKTITSPHTPNTSNEIVHMLDTIQEDKIFEHSSDIPIAKSTLHSYKKRTLSSTHSLESVPPLQINYSNTSNTSTPKSVNHPWLHQALSQSCRSMYDGSPLSPISNHSNYHHAQQIRHYNQSIISKPPVIHNPCNVPTVSTHPVHHPYPNQLTISMQLQPPKDIMIDHQRTPISDQMSDLSAISSSESNENIDSDEVTYENKDVSKENQSDSLNSSSRSKKLMIIISDNDESLSSSDSSASSNTESNIDTRSNVVQHDIPKTVISSNGKHSFEISINSDKNKHVFGRNKSGLGIVGDIYGDMFGY